MLEIDDASGFQTPVLTRSFTGSKFEFRFDDIGLIPGIRYHVRLDGGSTQDFRLAVKPFAEPKANCDMLRSTWEETGRLMTGVAFSAMR